jgi:hypothetical protein
MLNSKQSLCALFSVTIFYSKTELIFAMHPIFDIFVNLVQTPLMNGKGSYKMINFHKYMCSCAYFYRSLPQILGIQNIHVSTACIYISNILRKLII